MLKAKVRNIPSMIDVWIKDLIKPKTQNPEAKYTVLVLIKQSQLLRSVTDEGTHVAVKVLTGRVLQRSCKTELNYDLEKYTLLYKVVSSLPCCTI